MKTNKKKLFVGPWVGEFGWELFCWHGMVRAYVEGRRGEFGHVTVCSRAGHEFLYAGLYDRYCPIGITDEGTDMWKNRNVSVDDVMNFRGYADTIGEYEWLKPDNYRVDRRRAPHRFVPFRNRCPLYPHGFDVLMHVRDTDKCGTGYRNWPVEHAKYVARTLARQGLTIACIGLRESSALISDTEDFRDIPLDELANLMSSSKVVVGPTSGPVHFATLCGTPQVTWMTKTAHEVRVRNTWNPFKAPVRTLPSPSDDHWRKRVMWLPAAEDIYNSVMRALEGDFK